MLRERDYTPPQYRQSIAIHPETARLYNEVTNNGREAPFMTGFENSDPEVDGKRRNQLREAHDLYQYTTQRVDNLERLGLHHIRFGEGYSQVHTGPASYNLRFSQRVIESATEKGMEVYYDGLHFGTPKWIPGHFQNPDMPYHYADYMKEVAKSFPQITRFTLANEPGLTARFSALYGLWNEQQADKTAFVTAAGNIAKAAILAREGIEEVWQSEKRPGSPLYFQNESMEKTITHKGIRPEDEQVAQRFNTIHRFITLDLILGHSDEKVRQFALQHGMTEKEYTWFMHHGTQKNTILGIDHYPGCIKEFTTKGCIVRTTENECGFQEVVSDYGERYNWPVMQHMEVNAEPTKNQDLHLLERTSDAIIALRQQGVPIAGGPGWFGDDIQVDWNTALTRHNNQVNNLGLFYKGEAKPIATRYKKMQQQGLPPAQLHVSA